ncbi:tRNA (adenosine(37)-N6)-threonylcarbamoyltransferase complex dimerization subunit type 1 TsaB [Brachyspira hampsonii]|uniref:Inactive metal-dependent protease molecular chaperone n=1 Tax=Brachyspira hampsonii 30446 TaxID=1289135 RepID=A0A2U4EV15_9SPIR|nr:tRNA (adenosine(37)-N6)-threonylcarbamoyltransferase complex dimerization subunit type 1 TsaB [Brachyspira hampsonii]EKV56515.1 inactive metal-dependent protease molecular chaperone [Brachyspira hampsonii 30446]MBW5390876.1 tRNA (adenosine(37)-N6)-threonylcarbamoyltransferase complex dimerization subunit type 1 TsaB [Brachyspira hampsonii]MBW5395950.1 tRNA (adenosine(37)-N6)-threonylcarbamoyltransferase complex dimerization subunit type 1 TsaB [Brachyspira hampsonii]OEJ17707.1 tRNA N6-adenos
MNILAFDTVSTSFSIAIQKEDGSIIEYNKEDVRNHNEEILPVLDNFLKVNNFPLDKIDCIVLGIGPGSFTALRIAFATVKTICYTRNIPIVGISSLETLYKNISEKEGIKAAMIDARKGSIYANIYNNDEKIAENTDLTYQQFIDIINSIKSSGKNITLCGDGFYKNQDYFKENLKDYKINNLDKSFNIIRASNSIKLSMPRIKSNNFDNIFNLLPLYLRNSEAENKKNQ